MSRVLFDVGEKDVGQGRGLEQELDRRDPPVRRDMGYDILKEIPETRRPSNPYAFFA
jgi:hypothetical protein